MDIQEPNRELELLSNLDKIKRTVFREYLYHVSEEFTIYPFERYNTYQNSDARDTKRVVFNTNIQCFRVERWVYDQKEQIIDRFANVYGAFAQRTDAIALVVDRTVKGADFYFVIRSDSLQKSNELKTRNTLELLKDSVKGNFPGTITHDVGTVAKQIFDKGNYVWEDIWHMESKKSAAAITCISSDKSEKHISQGLEKLLNGISPHQSEEEYTIVFLADPVNHEELLRIKNGYESLASSIYGYGEYQSNKTLTHASTDGTSWASAHTTGTNSAISKTRGVNIGANTTVNASAGWLTGVIKNVVATKSGSAGVNAGLQYSRTVTEGTMASDTITDGTNHCVSEGNSEGETRNIKSYPVTDMIHRIEKQIERLDECEGVGMWRSAAYVLAGNMKQAENVANYLLGIIQGKDSFVEASVINTWSAAKSRDEFYSFLEYVRHFVHPVFINRSDIQALGQNKEIDISKAENITLANYVTSIELANTMSFPYKSVKGLSCIECAEFERNVLYKDLDRYLFPEQKEEEKRRELCLGQIYHMHEFEDVPVPIDIDELTKHTFITGSTGSGKSTTIYKILHELNDKYKIPFMVIEPAKGEYCIEFGDVAEVYSTNYNYGKLLRINPFYFPSEGDDRILVSEHIDRLVEIFSVCWPMYAAMPAVLKEALESAYEEAGWNLITSINSINPGLFPTFIDLLVQLRNVINHSDFSEEVKSNYTGSLVTRVKSLTNGLYRQIFSAENIEDKELFGKNVIVDISKVGSSETKALLMGILVMRMQEYHMAVSRPVKQLEHITVLEEAHNLLRKTSTEQSSENANVMGKSVEMLSNAIAEMRTYGEGFIIADQAPGMLDESVIRNTNTKMIMSLPDYSDREIVGRSVGLSEEQVKEITRLPNGKAVIYQNNWVAPVLCAVKAYGSKTGAGKKRRYSQLPQENISNDKKAEIINFVLHNKIDDIKEIEEKYLLGLNVPVTIKSLILSHRNSENIFEKQEQIDITYAFYASDHVKKVLKRTESNLCLADDWEEAVFKAEFQKWIEALGVTEKIEKTDLMGIINIILYKMEEAEQIGLEQCERLFDFAGKWRW